MGRRWGKTVLGGTLSLGCAARGASVAWIVPTYKNGRPLWRWAEATVAPLRKAGHAEVHRAERVMQFTGGGFLGVYSMDNEDSIRGEAFHLVIVDEAARIPESAWTDAIMPTLADYDGRAILISTPKGRNWFWQEWIRGQAEREDVKSWQAPTRDNPNPRIRRAAELAQDRVPERTYRQEWLAEFVEDGSVFRNVRAVARGEKEPPRLDAQYIYGIDWGRLVDYTAISIWDALTRREVALERFNAIEYVQQEGRLMGLVERYTPAAIVAEQNAIGLPIIERLLRLHLPVRPFVTTNATKAQIVDDLALALEQQSIILLDNPIATAELEAFEAQRLPSGLIRYSAPEGMHDDTVMARCLGWHGVRTSAPPTVHKSKPTVNRWREY